MPLTTSIADLLAAASQAGATSSDGSGTPGKPLYTGRYIAVFKEDATPEAIQQFLAGASVKSVSAASFDSQAVSFGDLADAEVLTFPNVGLALVSPEGYAALQSPNTNADNNAAVASTDGTAGDGTVPASSAASASADSPLDSWEQETFFYVDDDDDSTTSTPADSSAPADSSTTPADSSTTPADSSTTPADSSTTSPADTSTTTPDSSTASPANVTCGLDITLVAKSTFDGTGIKLCVLDTGLDLNHPDFAGRTIVSASFIPTETVQDGHSHGTHTAGTAAGPKTPASGPRYGIAYGATLYIGKVLDNTRWSVGGSVIAGMNWALANNCDVVSMSLSAPSGVFKGYTRLGQKALDQKSLFIAASGNDSSRPGNIANTGAPANSPTIMSVAAVDCTCNIAPFSNGGKIEIAGPGVDVLSSVPMPTQYGKKSGTSMATPHVAGIAALWAQSDATFRGQALWSALTGAAKNLSQPATDVGAGLVQAPIPGGVCQ